LRGRARPASTLITRFIADHQGHREGPDGLRCVDQRVDPNRAITMNDQRRQDRTLLRCAQR
ncbi:hypothetical protein DSI90_01685, partial [Mycobacterium tuberculosis]